MDFLIDNMHKIKYIESYREKGFEHVFTNISTNPNITKEFVLSNVNEKWDWYELRKRIDFTEEDFIDAKWEDEDSKWICLSISIIPNITIESFIELIENEIIDFDYLNEDPCIRLDLLKATLDNEHWYWPSLSFNPNITFDFVIQNLGKDWDWKYISLNPNVTIEHVLAYPDLPWCWRSLCKNQNLKFDHLIANPDLPWDWKVLSRNINWRGCKNRSFNIPIDFVMKHLDKDWDWKELSKSVDLNLDIVKKSIAAKMNILNQWYESFYNPNYVACIDRLRSEFDELL